MSKTGGPATLSSLRVQKAFSINFRENKRLYAQLKLIEAGRVRAIRQVKQEITETKLWLEGVQQTTGDSDKTWMDSDSRNSSRLGRRSTSRLSENEHKAAADDTPRISAEEAGLYRGQESSPQSHPTQHVRFSQSVRGQRPSIPSIEVIPPQSAPSGQRQSFSQPQKSEAMPDITEEANKEVGEVTELYGESVGKSRLQSANSRNSQQSLTAYQRRKQLKSLILKKRNPLDIKKEINSRECAKVNDKVMDYVLNIADRLHISVPDFETSGVPVLDSDRSDPI